MPSLCHCYVVTRRKFHPVYVTVNLIQFVRSFVLGIFFCLLCHWADCRVYTDCKRLNWLEFFHLLLQIPKQLENAVHASKGMLENLRTEKFVWGTKKSANPNSSHNVENADLDMPFNKYEQIMYPVIYALFLITLFTFRLSLSLPSPFPCEITQKQRRPKNVRFHYL